jgi:hypothetical protein
VKLEESPARGAHDALSRLLRLAVPDPERRREVIDEALRSATKLELPTVPTELLDFVRRHLVPTLTNDVGPSLAFAILADLSSALESSSASGSRNTPMVEALVAVPAESPLPAVRLLDRLPLPKLRDSVTRLARSVREVIHPRDRKLIESADRRKVFLVNADRVLRATSARALLRAGFDVEAVDCPEDVLPALRSQRGSAIAMLDLTDVATREALPILVAVSHELRVVATSAQGQDVATTLLGSAGVRRFVVLPKHSTPGELVDAARELVAS